MLFDPNNHVIELCAQGMNMEGEGKRGEALELFQRAWDEAINDLEKLISAHYIARHQKDTSDKLKWDEIALTLALNVNDENVKGLYPSLYLNVGKCYEDLNDFDNARKNFELVHSYIHFLPDDGYGKMIKDGILNGLARVRLSNTNGD